MYLYNFCLLFLGLFYLPKFKKYKHLWPHKIGRSFDTVSRGAGPLIWIHAVSMGETKAVWKFADLLRQKHPHAEFLVTSVTETGHAEAKKTFPFAKYHLFLPFDFSWIIRPIIARLKPDLVLLSETDFWYNFLTEAKKNGATIAVVSGKLSPRSLKRYKFLTYLMRSFFSPVDLFCMQNALYKDRLLELNISPEKVFVTGNLKFDAEQEVLETSELAELKSKLAIKDSDLVIVAGSTHETEEALILEAILKLLPTYPNLKVLFVPRHPERFPRVEDLLKNTSLPTSKWTAPREATLILIDTMGYLKKCYQLADLAIMGGSFVAHVGGHNVLEPAFYGIPVLFGPHMHTQEELKSLVLDAKAGLQVRPENLAEAMENLLSDQDKRVSLSNRGKALTQTLQGTSQRTLDLIENKFPFSLAGK